MAVGWLLTLLAIASAPIAPQPLEPLMGSRLAERNPPVAGALVSVQASLRINEQTMLLGAPALIGGPGEAACLL